MGLAPCSGWALVGEPTGAPRDLSAPTPAQLQGGAGACSGSGSGCSAVLLVPGGPALRAASTPGSRAQRCRCLWAKASASQHPGSVTCRERAVCLLHGGPREQDPGHAAEAPRIVPGTRRALHKCLWLRSLSSVPWVCWEVDKRPQRCLNLNPQTREMRQVMRRGGIRLQRESGLLVSWSRHEGESWIIQRHHGVLLKGRRRQRGRERGVTAEAGAERASVAGLADGGRAESQGMRVASGSWGRPGEEFPPGSPRGARPARLPISAPGGPSRPPETHSCEMTDSC